MTTRGDRGQVNYFLGGVNYIAFQFSNGPLNTRQPDSRRAMGSGRSSIFWSRLFFFRTQRGAGAAG